MSAEQLPNLETFAKAAELSSFTAAARALGLTQAAVSQRIQALELALKSPLFQRQGGHVLLTDAGHRLYVYAQRILALHREAIQDINRDRRGAAEAYVRITKEKISVDEILELINNPEFEFTMTPKNLMKIVGFMSEVGHIKVKPETWKDLFFPEVHNLPGS